MGIRDEKRRKNLEKKRNFRANKVVKEEMFNYSFLITMEYDGYEFGGYAKQKHKNTIQNQLEDSLEIILGKKIKTVESSRTDAKVHAKDQKVMFKFYKALDCNKLSDSLNTMLSKSINIVNIEPVHNDFHCRYDVTSKTYKYVISKTYSPFNRMYSYYHAKPLNVEKMRKASKHLIGEHDFTSFCSTRATQESKIREIFNIEVYDNSDEIIIEVTGSGFLYNMVRIIAGTLIEVGENRKNPNDIKQILSGMDRKLAGVTAPPQALFLEKINY